MKKLTLILTFIAASKVLASEIDYKVFFSHPDCQIIIKIADTHSESPPYKNHLVLKKITPNQLIHPSIKNQPIFFGGQGYEVQGKDQGTVNWEFIEKTAYGDLYLFTIKKDDKLIKAVPALYNGSSIQAYQQGDISISIETL